MLLTARTEPTGWSTVLPDLGLAPARAADRQHRGAR